MLPPKLRHILGCLAFSEFFCPKLDSTPVKSLFENTMGNPFFDFFKYWPNLFKKKKRMEIWAFSFLNLLSEAIFDFGKWSNWKYTFTHIRVFSVWPLPEAQNRFRKHIWNENVHIFILNFFKAFWSIFKKVKLWISRYIFKKWFERRRVYFLKKFFSEKAKHPNICLCLGGSMPEAQIK